jgi:hypothetical protein
VYGPSPTISNTRIDSSLNADHVISSPAEVEKTHLFADQLDQLLAQNSAQAPQQVVVHSLPQVAIKQELAEKQNEQNHSRSQTPMESKDDGTENTDGNGNISVQSSRSESLNLPLRDDGEERHNFHMDLD